MFKLLYKLMGLTPATTQDAANNAVTAEAPAAKEPAKPVTPAGEDVSRVDLLQMMWGTGFGFPGNAAYIKELVQPMALDSQKSVLDLTAGLGGAARTIAGTFKTYVTAFERDGEMADAGNKMSARGGFGKTAPVTHYDPRKIEYDKKADAVLARGLINTFEDKDALLTRIASMLKPHGHLILNDFTAPADKLEDIAVKEWVATEPFGAYPVPVEEIEKALKKHGFDVRVKEDVSQAYAKAILKGLAAMAHQLEGKKLTPASKELVRRETDIWLKRLMALDGKAGYFRFYAIKAR